MDWRTIAYYSRSSLIRIQGTMTEQPYVDDVLKPVTLPFLQGFRILSLKNRITSKETSEISEIHRFSSIDILIFFPERIPNRFTEPTTT
ncbi:hypothetical protein LAZ67_3004043 [Cordylochernes scorpioides]|uniref:Uncharacterized protein n=1 Tax=Cordylochernes scorpioides TaxID=51811 RepID=A0ABY6K9B3_9ARAC|nr:hypothetical protein LAZ67_3004043 [Cordylochernes scorpioides]